MAFLLRKKYYLLDRNVVNLIKQSNAGNSPIKVDELDMLQKLRSLDLPNNTFSPILSIMEGQQGGIENQEEKRETIKKECKEVAQFFRNANTDEFFLLKDLNNHSYVLAESREKQFQSYKDFLCSVSTKIFQPVAKNKRTEIKNEIIKVANIRKIPLVHPVTICCLSVLYGCIISQKVLKFTSIDYDPHNAISDILMITDISRFKAPPSSKKENWEFLTLDKNLEKLYKLILINSTLVNVESGEYLVKTYYPKDLFPDLKEIEYHQLMYDLDAE